jgi:hypothetical protein
VTQRSSNARSGVVSIVVAFLSIISSHLLAQSPKTNTPATTVSTWTDAEKSAMADRVRGATMS